MGGKNTERKLWWTSHENILTAPFMVETIRTTADMYAHGWDERNGGNISLLLGEAFGLIETAEKAAEIYLKIAHLPRLNTITDEQLHELAAHLGVTVRAGYLMAGHL